jgi:hypothetical protein
MQTQMNKQAWNLVRAAQEREKEPPSSGAVSMARLLELLMGPVADDAWPQDSGRGEQGKQRRDKRRFEAEQRDQERKEEAERKKKEQALREKKEKERRAPQRQSEGRGRRHRKNKNAARSTQTTPGSASSAPSGVALTITTPAADGGTEPLLVSGADAPTPRLPLVDATAAPDSSSAPLPPPPPLSLVSFLRTICASPTTPLSSAFLYISFLASSVSTGLSEPRALDDAAAAPASASLPSRWMVSVFDELVANLLAVFTLYKQRLREEQPDGPTLLRSPAGGAAGWWRGR